MPKGNHSNPSQKLLKFLDKSFQDFSGLHDNLMDTFIAWEKYFVTPSKAEINKDKILHELNEILDELKEKKQITEKGYIELQLILKNIPSVSEFNEISVDDFIYIFKKAIKKNKLSYEDRIQTSLHQSLEFSFKNLEGNQAKLVNLLTTWKKNLDEMSEKIKDKGSIITKLRQSLGPKPKEDTEEGELSNLLTEVEAVLASDEIKVKKFYDILSDELRIILRRANGEEQYKFETFSSDQMQAIIKKSSEKMKQQKADHPNNVKVVPLPTFRAQGRFFLLFMPIIEVLVVSVLGYLVARPFFGESMQVVLSESILGLIVGVSIVGLTEAIIYRRTGGYLMQNIIELIARSRNSATPEERAPLITNDAQNTSTYGTTTSQLNHASQGAQLDNSSTNSNESEIQIVIEVHSNQVISTSPAPPATPLATHDLSFADEQEKQLQFGA